MAPAAPARELRGREAVSPRLEREATTEFRQFKGKVEPEFTGKVRQIEAGVQRGFDVGPILKESEGKAQTLRGEALRQLGTLELEGTAKGEAVAREIEARTRAENTKHEAELKDRLDRLNREIQAMRPDEARRVVEAFIQEMSRSAGEMQRELISRPSALDAEYGGKLTGLEGNLRRNLQGLDTNLRQQVTPKLRDAERDLSRRRLELDAQFRQQFDQEERRLLQKYQMRPEAPGLRPVR